MLRFLAALLKIALASLLTGAGLSIFNISSAQILEQTGLTPDVLWAYLLRFTDWALPNILLGSMIVLPIWLLTYVFLPPRERDASATDAPAPPIHISAQTLPARP